MSSWHSYPSIYAIGHRAANDLFEGPVVVEEKLDGSQFSFGIFDGEVKCRSKGQQLIVDAPEKMFSKAVASVLERKDLLRDGWTYRGEYFRSPKHNTLSYGRIPTGHIAIFDINTDEETYLNPCDKLAEAERINLESVPCFWIGEQPALEDLTAFMERESFLGGVKIEGFVVKNYNRFGVDKKALMGKFVSEAFKEAHSVAWKVSNPQKADVIQSIIAAYRTDARWIKAIGHLRDAGNLDGSPKDIGNLIKEVQADIIKECSDEIARALLHWAKPQILRGVTAGLPEWYKDRLLASAFEPATPEQGECRA